MSETYTAVYERDGDGWLVTIAEEPRVNGRGATPGEARAHIQEALGACLQADPTRLRIVDSFSMPALVRATQEEVKATRTEEDRRKMHRAMTDGRTAEQWAEDLDLGERDPKTVEWLKSLGGGVIEIDHLCSTITMAEDMSRWHGEGPAELVPEEN
ncbi:MAG: type II toxin-antitoxin system HicB family antitoxin [Actinomycetota bacterium]